MDYRKDFETNEFTAPAGRLHEVTEAVIQRCDTQAKLRVLDIGCGTGGHVFSLAGRLPNAELHGVDISEPSIQSAERSRLESPFSDRLNFSAIDYMEYHKGTFDVIVSDTTLHLIPTQTEELFTKITKDLVGQGILVVTMPYDCPYNTLLWTVRRVFRLFRGSLTDAIIFRVGRFLHGGDVPDGMIRQRIHYMYNIPFRSMNKTLMKKLTGALGLELLYVQPIAQTSPAMIRHKLYVFRKKALSASEAPHTALNGV